VSIASTTASSDEEPFPEFDFSLLSEADIREEIIAPALRRLGYRSGALNTVIREKAIELRYPHMFLGRKKPGKDPVLRGRPDYLCEARNIARWAIEAKPPNEGIQRNESRRIVMLRIRSWPPLFFCATAASGRSLRATVVLPPNRCRY
jgi:hypothetical protein